jgi:iron complex outermembrane receptor protein
MLGQRPQLQQNEEQPWEGITVILKRNVLALALASVGFCATSAAYAATPQSDQTADQSAPVTQDASNTADTPTREKIKAKKLEAVQVNGFASSIENATAIKKNADTIVEAVSSEQIGKLPGTSIADSLGRLPGLAVQTVGGRPQVLSIHGLPPDFSTVLVNGGQQVSTSNNRDVQLDQYPSSWFDNVIVHMSQSANLVGQGLAGTVDMQTIRPLDKDKAEGAVNAHYVWDGKSQLASGPGVSDKGYNVNGIWVDQFADHTFGVTLGVDLESNPQQIERQQPWGYANASDGSLLVGGSKNYGISDSFKRQGLLSTFQWKPNDFFNSTLDLTYDNFKETQQAKGIEFPLAYGAGVTLEPGYNAQDGFVRDGTYDNVKGVIRNDYNQTKNKVWNIGWRNEFKFSDDWSGELDAHYSRADSRQFQLESYSGTGYNVGSGATDTLGFSELPNGKLYLDSSLDYGGNQIVLTDPQGWGAGGSPSLVQAGFINAPRTNDYLANLKASIKRDFVSGPFSSVEAGVVRGTRKKTYNIGQTFLTLGGGAFEKDADGNPTNVPVETAPYSGGSCDSLSWMGIAQQACYNPLEMIANGTYTELSTALSSIAVPPNWKVSERDLASYLQFNLDTTVGNVGLRGNFGIQVAHTNQSSEGQRVTATTANAAGQANAILVPVTGGTSYTRYLPSANLIFSFNENNDLRFSAARVMAQPRMDQMSASLGVTGNITRLTETDPNQSYFSATGGNAKLLPTMADNYNISYEHYLSGDSSGYQCNSSDAKQSDLCRSGGGGGYIAVSGYYYKLKDYINPSAAYLYDFAAFVPSYLTPAQQAQLGTTQGIVSGPTNDGRGYVKGLQAELNLPFGNFSPVLNGLGTLLSGNYTKSAMTYAGNPDPLTVPNLSKWVANATLYYQHNGFEARIGDSYRSSFLGDVSGISATRIEQTIKGGSSYDAQVSYSFDHGPLTGLTLIAQGSNLSNKSFVTYQNNDPRQVLTWESYGRRYEVGISYKFQ